MIILAPIIFLVATQNVWNERFVRSANAAFVSFIVE